MPCRNVARNADNTLPPLLSDQVCRLGNYLCLVGIRSVKHVMSLSEVTSIVPPCALAISEQM